MNENICNFLNSYIEDSDPRYGVLLDGAWGCGKTYFVQSWVKGLAKKKKSVLKPIEVSLFGLNKVSQINDAINRVLFPVLDKKYYKIARGVVGTIGKAVLKCNVDFDNDGKADGTLDIQLDPLMSLFNSKGEINKGWFFVFDDIERCNIDMKTLFGYINDFVERRQFHVIIICNSNEIAPDDKPVFDKFKEKVIGRSFVVQPDVRAAVNSFLRNVPKHDFTVSNAVVIEKVFTATGFNNLRVIRQAIRDCNKIWLFCNLVEKNMFYHEFILQQFESGFTVHAPFHYFQLVDESFCNAVGNIESDSVSYSLEISFNTYNKCLQ